MDGAIHTHAAIRLLGRAWAGPLRQFVNRLTHRRVAAPLDAAVPAPAHRSVSSAGGAILLVQMAGARCAALVDTLAVAGYDVQVVAGLPAAISRVRRRPPALVVVDGHAEPDAYRVLRQAGAFPILALIPQPADAQVLAAFAVGVDDCQANHTTKAELMLRIHNMLSPMERRGALVAPSAEPETMA